jgi:hypothetical protein
MTKDLVSMMVFLLRFSVIQPLNHSGSVISYLVRQPQLWWRSVSCTNWSSERRPFRGGGRPACVHEKHRDERHDLRRDSRPTKEELSLRNRINATVPDLQIRVYMALCCQYLGDRTPHRARRLCDGFFDMVLSLHKDDRKSALAQIDKRRRKLESDSKAKGGQVRKPRRAR